MIRQQLTVEPDWRRRVGARWVVSLGLLTMLVAVSAHSQSVEIELPEVVLTGVPFSVSVHPVPATDPGDAVAATVREAEAYRLRSGDQQFDGMPSEAGGWVFEQVEVGAAGAFEAEVTRAGTVVGSVQGRALRAWLSILPTLLAIAAALWFRSVLPALFAGVWLGTWLIAGATPGDLFSSLLGVFQVYVLDAVVDRDRLSVMLFSFMIGGMIGIVRRGGGMEAVVARVIQFADTARRGQVATAALGTVVFFDDYANTLVVGTSMRPVADRLRISREKLAFLVDSTAAPVTCIALISTWVGYEVGLLGRRSASSRVSRSRPTSCS